MTCCKKNCLSIHRLLFLNLEGLVYHIKANFQFIDWGNMLGRLKKQIIVNIILNKD